MPQARVPPVLQMAITITDPTSPVVVVGYSYDLRGLLRQVPQA